MEGEQTERSDQRLPDFPLCDPPLSPRTASMNDLSESPPSRRVELALAAARLFREKGYDRTTVRDIAEVVGMKSGSLFYHFKSKEEMLVEAMGHGVRAANRRGQEALAGLTDPRQRLVALFKAHMHTLLVGDGRDSMFAIFYEWRSLSDEGRSSVGKLRDDYETLWRSVLREAAQAGIVVGDIEVLGRFMLGGMNWAVQWYNPAGRLDVDQICESILAALLR